MEIYKNTIYILKNKNKNPTYDEFFIPINFIYSISLIFI